MKRTILSLFCLGIVGVGASILLSSSSGGRAFATNSGNTGAPGENNTCRTCHGTGFGTSVSMTVKDDNGETVTPYIPGTIYTIDFTVNSTGGAHWGYQLTSLDAGNNPIATFSNPSANSRLVTLGSGRQYAEHRGRSSTNTFSTDWTAPASGTGNVTFYGGGAATNNNGRTSGDGGNTLTVVLTEDSVVGISEVNALSAVRFYPNPTKDYLTIDASNNFTLARVSLVDKKGVVVFQQQMNLSALQRIDTDPYKNGVYLLKVEGEEQSFVSKVVFK